MGPVTRVGDRECDGDAVGRSGDLHSWRSLDTGQDRVDAPARERADRIVTTHLTQLPHCRHGEVVVGVLQLGTSGGGESIPLRGPAASVVLPGRCGVRFGVADFDERIEVSAHTGRRDAQPVADLACGGGTLEEELDDRSAGVPIGGRRDSGRSRPLRADFHNTIVTEFRKLV
jgi:hypothetical protein